MRVKSQKGVTAAYRAAAARYRRAQEAAGPAAAEDILRESNRTVPVDTGALQESGHVNVEGDRAIVEYNTPYAVIVHEDMEAEHTTGGPRFLAKAIAKDRKAFTREFLHALARD